MPRNKANPHVEERTDPTMLPIPKRRQHDGDAYRTSGTPHADAEGRREENRNQQDLRQDEVEDAEEDRASEDA